MAIKRGPKIPKVNTKLDWLTLFLLNAKVIRYIKVKYACREKNSLGFKAGHLNVFPKKYKNSVMIIINLIDQKPFINVMPIGKNSQ